MNLLLQGTCQTLGGRYQSVIAQRFSFQGDKDIPDQEPGIASFCDGALVYRRAIRGDPKLDYEVGFYRTNDKAFPKAANA